MTNKTNKAQSTQSTQSTARDEFKFENRYAAEVLEYGVWVTKCYIQSDKLLVLCVHALSDYSNRVRFYALRER